MQSSRHATLDSDLVGSKHTFWMIDVHEECEKNYQEVLKQTVPLQDILKK
jgi:hypothetical protein